MIKIYISVTEVIKIYYLHTQPLGIWINNYSWFDNIYRQNILIATSVTEQFRESNDIFPEYKFDQGYTQFTGIELNT